jgi:acyl carrier protein
MTQAAAAEELIVYIKEKVLRDRSIEITVDTRLVSSGLIDSFALIDLLLQLEKLTKRRISPGRVSPREMDTVALMLSTAERIGKMRS